jgi:hypothetical protein
MGVLRFIRSRVLPRKRLAHVASRQCVSNRTIPWGPKLEAAFQRVNREPGPEHLYTEEMVVELLVAAGEDHEPLIVALERAISHCDRALKDDPKYSADRAFLKAALDASR